MSRAYAVLVLALILPMPIYAQDPVEALLGDEDFDGYPSPETVPEELWEQELDLLCIDVDTLCDILLELCLDMELADQEIYEMFPDLWGQDYYDPYLLWEDEWYFENEWWCPIEY